MDEKQCSILDKFFNEAIERLKRSHIVLPKEAVAHIYHHMGIDRIYEVGAMFINVVNRDYCKSIVVMAPEQKYPVHYHRIKTESFYVLSGTLNVVVDGQMFVISPGEMLHVERGQDHSFFSHDGVVFEEISTKYVPNDSMYLDEVISRTGYAQRRTTISAEEWKERIKSC